MGTSPSSATEAVIDASAIVQALAYGRAEPMRWLERIADRRLKAAWPSHLYVEVANAVLKLVRARKIERSLAVNVVWATGKIHAVVFPIEQAVEDALEIAFERRISVYDAAYVVLAEALRAPLVTADRRLAAATEQGVLLPG